MTSTASSPLTNPSSSRTTATRRSSTGWRTGAPTSRGFTCTATRKRGPPPPRSTWPCSTGSTASPWPSTRSTGYRASPARTRSCARTCRTGGTAPGSTPGPTARTRRRSATGSWAAELLARENVQAAGGQMDPALAAGGCSVGFVRQERSTAGGGPGGQRGDDGVEEVVRSGDPVPVPAEVQPGGLLLEGRQQVAQAFGFGDAAALVTPAVEAPDFQ